MRGAQAGRRVYVGRLDTRRAGNVTVGSIICFDREQMETARMASQQGAEVILTPNGGADVVHPSIVEAK